MSARLLLPLLALLLALSPVPFAAAQDADAIAGLIDSLQAEEFRERDAAMDAIREVGRPALPQLRAALEATGDPDLTWRLEVLIEELEALPDPDQPEEPEVSPQQEAADRIGRAQLQMIFDMMLASGSIRVTPAERAEWERLMDNEPPVGDESRQTWLRDAMTFVARFSQSAQDPNTPDTWRLVVRKEDRYGYINSRGEEAIALRFRHAEPFADNGLALVNLDGAMAFIDADGDVVIPERNGLQFLRGFVGDVAVVGLTEPASPGEMLLGAINTSGALVIPPRYEQLGRCSDGWLPMKRDGSVHGFVSIRGTELTDPRFAEVGECSGSLGAVRIGERWGYVHLAPGPTGDGATLAIDARFATAGVFSEGLAFACRPDGTTGYIGESGEFAFTLEGVTGGQPFALGRALVRNTDGWHFVNREGARVGDDWDEARSFSSGLAAVRSGGWFGYINRDGDFAINPQYTRASDFAGPLASVTDEDGRDIWIWWDGAAIRTVWQSEPR